MRNVNGEETQVCSDREALKKDVLNNIRYDRIVWLETRSISEGFGAENAVGKENKPAACRDENQAANVCTVLNRTAVRSETPTA